MLYSFYKENNAINFFTIWALLVSIRQIKKWLIISYLHIIADR